MTVKAFCRPSCIKIFLQYAYNVFLIQNLICVGEPHCEMHLLRLPLHPYPRYKLAYQRMQHLRILHLCIQMTCLFFLLWYIRISSPNWLSIDNRSNVVLSLLVTTSSTRSFLQPTYEQNPFPFLRYPPLVSIAVRRSYCVWIQSYQPFANRICRRP